MKISGMDDTPAKFIIIRKKEILPNGFHKNVFEITSCNDLGKDEFTNALMDLILKHIDNGDKPV